jgi:hypothetical protein
MSVCFRLGMLDTTIFKSTVKRTRICSEVKSKES